jgi:DNA-directed RNA polymerase beta' subunit
MGEIVWKNVESVTVDDELVSLSSDGQIEFLRPVATHGYPVDNVLLYTVETDFISMEVTLDHSIPVVLLDVWSTVYPLSTEEVDGSCPVILGVEETKFFAKNAKLVKAKYLVGKAYLVSCFDPETSEYFALVVNGLGQDDAIIEREVPVFCVTLPQNNILLTKTEGDALPHWSGNSGRHGNKGVITSVVPDEDMPRDADGHPIEIIVNPSGVPGRINVGQVFETVLGKVANKEGSIYAVSNFEPDDDRKIVKVKGHFRTVNTSEGPKKKWISGFEYERGYHGELKRAAAAADVNETTVLFDPSTGNSLGDVLVGHQYIIKHMHQVEKKLSSRSYGAGMGYDHNKVPKGGGKTGSQTFGELGLYAMLAHGAVHNIRDALTYKCFPYHTKVATDQGDVEIGKIVHNRLPVRVLSLGADGLEYRNIRNFWSRPMSGVPMYKVRARNTTIFSSDTHEFYTSDTPHGDLSKTWAKDVGGKYLVTHAEGNPIFTKVKSVECVSETGELAKWRGTNLYNLEVEENHNYFVNGVLVGNSDMSQRDVWDSIQTGNLLPPPETAFAYEKFLSYMRAMGINVEKNGSDLVLTPFTDEQVVSLSNGELSDPSKLVRGKDLKPEAGGLFDEKITGGAGQNKWSHFTLSEPTPNPIFEKAIIALLGITGKQFDEVIAGRAGFDKNGEYAVGPDAVSVGGQSITSRLQSLDIDKELKLAEESLMSARKGKLDKANKKLKYLKMLKKHGLSPQDAYIINKLAVIPTIFRPITVMEGGDLNVDGLNRLYRDVAIISDKLRDGKDLLPDEELTQIRSDLYEAMSALAGITTPQANELSLDGNAKPQGILSLISGRTPKDGFFHKYLLKRKQDLAMRSVIVPDMNLHLDEIGIPRKGAMEIFKPFVVRELVKMGYTPLLARDEIDKKSSVANRALEVAVSTRPVLFKRDPVLHKFGIMAFKAKLHDERSIHIHPLVTSGFNADFDGDSVDLDTPIPIKILGNMGYATGRELLDMLGTPSGNWVFRMNNMEVLTYSGWTSVRNISFHTCLDKKKYRVTLKNGRSFIVSEDHSLMVGGEEVKPTELTLGTALDHVTPEFPTSPQLVSQAKIPDTYNAGVIFGHYLGDGSVETGARNRVSIACKDDDVKEYLKDLWVTELAARPGDYGHGYFQMHDKELASSIEYLGGKYCDGKRVADVLLESSEEFRKGLLAGYILADGSVETTPSGSFLIRTWSKSKILRDQISLIASGLGLEHSVRERKKGEDTHYLVSFGKESIKVIDYRCPGDKRTRIDRARYEYENKRNDRRVSQSARGWEVKSIEEVEYNDLMIDIEVESDEHVFAILDGVIVHNTMAVFVPVSQEAVDEVYKLLPSRNLFNPATGEIMYQPTLEGQLGMFLLSQFGSKTDKSFSSASDIVSAAKSGDIKATDVVKLKGKDTTAGRVHIYNALPSEVRNDDILFNPDSVMGKRGLSEVLRETAIKAPAKFADTVDKVKNLGFGHAHNIGFSFGIDDFKPLVKIRDKHLNLADVKVRELMRNTPRGEDLDAAIVKVYQGATKDINDDAKKYLESSGNKLYAMHKAGVKPAWSQLQQMVLAPMLLTNAKGNIIPVPVKQSYGEGLSSSGYWVAASGARKGVLEKVQSVRDPGALSKQLMNTVIATVITADDCGTTEGISLDIRDPDIVDRFLAKSTKVGDTTISAGSVVTPSLLSKLKGAKVNKLVVRSPLKCTKAKGMCASCYGLMDTGKPPSLGTNIGAISGQSIGERAVQISMRTFHSGGVAGTEKTMSGFDRLVQLLKFPEKIAGSATLSEASGSVTSVNKNAAGGWDIEAGGKRMYVPGNRKLTVSLGDTVRRGQKLSEGPVNPRDLLEQTDMKTVQRYLSDEINSIYSSEGVKRRNVEVVTRSLTNLGVVTDAGDSDEVQRGDYVSLSSIAEKNKGLAVPTTVDPVLRGVETLPLDQTTDWLARMQYRRLKDTIRQGAMEGWQSDIHGTHPIPGIVYSAEFGKPGKSGKVSNDGNGPY